jgi:hypothetical protein
VSETNQNQASANIALVDLLFFSNLSPSRWAHLSEAERADWARKYREAGVQPGEPERVQGRAPQAGVRRS